MSSRTALDRTADAGNASLNQPTNQPLAAPQIAGFAYVEFLEADAVEAACLLEGSELHGRALKVSPKRTNVPGMRARGGGRGRGRGRGGGMPYGMPGGMPYGMMMMMPPMFGYGGGGGGYAPRGGGRGRGRRGGGGGGGGYAPY